MVLIIAGAAVLTGAALLSSCSTQMTFMPDGRIGYTTDCSGSDESWSDCYNAVGRACGPAGYDIVSKDADKRKEIYANGTAYSTYVDGGSYTDRSLVVACRRWR
jgi:hypothetical protein